MTGSDCTLDTFKVTQYNKTFPWVHYCKGGVRWREGGISRCKSSLQMSKYVVNHSEDLRVLKCFLTESVSELRGSRMTKTLTGAYRVAAAHPSPHECLHNPTTVQT